MHPVILVFVKRILVQLGIKSLNTSRDKKVVLWGRYHYIFRYIVQVFGFPVSNKPKPRHLRVVWRATPGPDSFPSGSLIAARRFNAQQCIERERVAMLCLQSMSRLDFSLTLLNTRLPTS